MTAENKRHSRPEINRPLFFRVGRRGFYFGFRLDDGAFQCGLRLFHDRSQHYGNQRHGNRGIALWWRRSRKGDRGYPHTLTIKVLWA